MHDVEGAVTSGNAPASARPHPSADELAVEQHRGHLLGVGYRLTGSRVDAEDAVQDAWLRWEGLGPAGREAVRDLRAWLATAVARLCLDRVRSAPRRRERYVGPWLPEPVLAVPDTAGTPAEDPLAQLVRSEDVRLAALLVLERLSADQRVALVLHDVAGVPFADVAALLDCPVATARQHAVRARRAVAVAAAEEGVAPRVDLVARRAVLDAFVAALATGDATALAAVLHPDVALRSDGGGIVRAARRVVHGPSRVSRLLVALAAEARAALGDVRPMLVNGDPGLWVPTTPHPMVAVLDVLDGRARAVHLVLTPEKVRPPAGT